ncbi:MAG TPA: hypothetical protein VGV89_10985 [Thermoplasmata archaeon]|nr:hypothetical protein [Thermoplasmata archaeon]
MVWFEDPTFLTLLGTWVLVIGTILLMWWQTRTTRELNSATSVMALRERFDGTQIRKARKILATHLIHGQHDDVTNLEVGAYFELVGTLTHRRILDADLVWEAFGSWVTAYYWGLRHPVDVIGRARQGARDPLILHEFEWLERRILAQDRHHTGARDPTPEERDREANILLTREANLDLIE